MVKFDYLVMGLNALSRAHRVNTMSGHLGAAVTAGYFIAEQHPLLDAAVYSGIEGELDRIVRGESVFSPKKGAAVSVADMFEPHAKERAKPELVDDIAEALEGNIGETRESGLSIQRTGTSTIVNPCRRASSSNSTSNEKPSIVWRGKTASAASALKSLKPHWVSRMPGTAKKLTKE